MTPATICQALLMIGTVNSGPEMPYQMTFNDGLTTPQADGFVFSSGWLISDIYNDAEDTYPPAGGNNNLPTPWSASPIAGSPTPSGGNYLYFFDATPGASTYTITVPETVDARYVSFWVAPAVSGDLNITMAIIFRDATELLYTITASVLGYCFFIQRIDGVGRYLIPREDLSPGPGIFIDRIEFRLTSEAIYYFDDITFHE